MAINSNGDDFANVLISALQEYSHEINTILNDEIDVLAKEVVGGLKNDPIIPVRTGRYKKSFYVKNIAQGHGYKRVKIANRLYMVTHLLEYSHGNGKGAVTRAFPHWESADEKAQELYNNMIKKIKELNK